MIRSFDVNRPGSDIGSLQGGIAGGSLIQGVLKVGDEIEVRPGIVSKDKHGNVKYTPIFSRIESLFAEKNALQFAVPGGLIGVGTIVDPRLTRADRLVGQVLGHRGRLPEVYTEVRPQRARPPRAAAHSPRRPPRRRSRFPSTFCAASSASRPRTAASRPRCRSCPRTRS